MKFKLHSFIRAALIGMFAACSGAAAAAPAGILTTGAPALQPPSNTQNYVPGEILVKFKAGVSGQASAASVAAHGGAVKATLSMGLIHINLGANQSVQAAVASYRADPQVEYAQPNYIYHPTAATPSPASQYGQQWAFKNTGQTIGSTYLQPMEGYPSAVDPTDNPGTSGDDIDIEPAWGVITDCSSVIVAVIDSGVNYNQQDLATNMWNGGVSYPLHGYNFTSEGAANDPMDLFGHGTHVAGIIGAAGKTTTGVCWKAQIMALRVFDSAGGQGTDANIIAALNFAVANGAKVANMSLGGAPGAPSDQALSDAITSAQNGDMVVVVAAGNNSNNNDTAAVYPCNYTHANLICVAALDQAYNLASFSDYGATSVHVGAPGTNILSTFPGTTTLTSDSLSAASPWTITSGWGYGTWSNGTNTYNMIADPSTWPSGAYAANAADYVYKTFNFSGYNAATLYFYLSGVVNSGDAFGWAMSANGGNPFTTAGGVLLGAGSFSLFPSFTRMTSNVTPCLTSTCTLGFGLVSAAASAGATGPAVTWLTTQTLALNTNTYDTMEGTSMATPVVAGLATMLRAYNPQYTYADVVAAIENAGRATASLSGKTVTGKAIDATASLAYINKPTGLAAAVH